MKLRPLIIDDSVMRELESLKIHAETHPISKQTLTDPDAVPPGDQPEFSRVLTFGYRIVFSIEEHPSGFFRHLSMSVNEPGMLPNEFVVQEIMTNLGYVLPLAQCLVRLEQFGKNKSRQAVNVYEPCKTNTANTVKTENTGA